MGYQPTRAIGRRGRRISYSDLTDSDFCTSFTVSNGRGVRRDSMMDRIHRDFEEARNRQFQMGPSRQPKPKGKTLIERLVFVKQVIAELLAPTKEEPPTCETPSPTEQR